MLNNSHFQNTLIKRQIHQMLYLLMNSNSINPYIQLIPLPQIMKVFIAFFARMNLVILANLKEL